MDWNTRYAGSASADAETLFGHEVTGKEHHTKSELGEYTDETIQRVCARVCCKEHLLRKQIPLDQQEYASYNTAPEWDDNFDGEHCAFDADSDEEAATNTVCEALRIMPIKVEM